MKARNKTKIQNDITSKNLERFTIIKLCKRENGRIIKKL